MLRQEKCKNRKEQIPFRIYICLVLTRIFGKCVSTQPGPRSVVGFTMSRFFDAWYIVNCLTLLAYVVPRLWFEFQAELSPYARIYAKADLYNMVRDEGYIGNRQLLILRVLQTRTSCRSAGCLELDVCGWASRWVAIVSRHLTYPKMVLKNGDRTCLR